MDVFGVEMGFNYPQELESWEWAISKGKMGMNNSLDFYVITIGGRNARK